MTNKTNKITPEAIAKDPRLASLGEDWEGPYSDPSIPDPRLATVEGYVLPTAKTLPSVVVPHSRGGAATPLPGVDENHGRRGHHKPDDEK